MFNPLSPLESPPYLATVYYLDLEGDSYFTPAALARAARGAYDSGSKNLFTAAYTVLTRTANPYAVARALESAAYAAEGDDLEGVNLIGGVSPARGLAPGDVIIFSNGDSYRAGPDSTYYETTAESGPGGLTLGVEVITPTGGVRLESDLDLGGNGRPATPVADSGFAADSTPLRAPYEALYESALTASYEQLGAFYAAVDSPPADSKLESLRDSSYAGRVLAAAVDARIAAAPVEPAYTPPNYPDSPPRRVFTAAESAAAESKNAAYHAAGTGRPGKQKK